MTSTPRLGEPLRRREPAEPRADTTTALGHRRCALTRRGTSTVVRACSPCRRASDRRAAAAARLPGTAVDGEPFGDRRSGSAIGRALTAGIGTRSRGAGGGVSTSMAPTGANGSTPQANSTSLLKTLPTPQATRWSSSATPISSLRSSTRAHPRDRGIDVGVGDVGAGEVGTEVRESGRRGRAVRELDDRRGEAHRGPTVDLDDRAGQLRALPPPLPGAVQVPRARHPHVGAQRGTSLEPDEQVLADRLDRFDALAGWGRRPPPVAWWRVRRTSELPGERRTQPVGGAMQRVALGHAANAIGGPDTRALDSPRRTRRLAARRPRPARSRRAPARRRPCGSRGTGTGRGRPARAAPAPSRPTPNVTRLCPPRSRCAASSPSTSTTCAPAVRAGRPPSPCSGHGNDAPNGWAGSVAASTTAVGAAPSGGESRNERSRSTAPGSANCAAPSPATK